jgi:hypothetical protein
MQRFISFLLCLIVCFSMVSCSDADIASRNLSKDADYFNINRRVVFYNGITGEYMLSVEGYCSLDNARTSTELAITCKVGPNLYKKHFLGLSDNVTYFVEQLEPAAEGVKHYKVVFKPSAILPDIAIR